MLFSSRRTLTLPSAALPLLGPGLSALLLSGCFLGDAADGLECELDADCGLGVVCAADPEAAGAKCCGGSCLVAGNSTGPGSTSTTNGSESSSSSEGSSTTVAELCGNGAVDGGEDCDPMVENGPPCASDCSLLCGNDNIEEEEDCEGFQENPNCENCKYVSTCGNGSLDDGEICDVWSGARGVETCREDCTERVVFDWPGAEMAFSAFCTADGDCDEAWALDSNLVWGSGQYFHNDDRNPNPLMWPEAVLRSRVLSLPELQAGDVVRVELVHAYDLDFQTDTSSYVDYVELSLESADRSAPARNVPLDPVAISCGVGIGDVCVSKQPDTYCGGADTLERGAGSFDSQGKVATYDYPVPEDDIPSGAHRLRFRVRYDCNTFDNGMSPPPRPDPAWAIENVVVTVLRPGAV